MAPPADDGALRYLADEQKISILPGHTPDYSQATFCLQEEDHTLGNALRWMIMKDPQVEFCGYSVPHPSEYKINLRIQMYDNASSIAALLRALSALDDLCESIEEAYASSFNAGKWVAEEDTAMTLEQTREVLREAQRKKREAKAS